jgi:hypothetical protein
MMHVAPLSVLFLALLRGAVAQGSNGTTIRIELDPDAATVNGTCTATFYISLTAQLSIWFTNGVASYNNAYPQVVNPFVEFKNTFRNGPVGSDRLIQEEPLSGIAEGQQERKLCNKASCINCCPAYCNTYCGGGGGCNFCDDDDVRRKLRGGESRTTLAVNEDWWSGDETMQSSVAQSMEFAAQQWLSQNDPTQCMGYAWKLGVDVNYI